MKLKKLVCFLFRLIRRTSQGKCTVIIRYVRADEICERLISVVNCEASTGEYFVELVKRVVEDLNIEMRKCVGNSTGGASNIQGHYKGFSAFLSIHSPNQSHVLCYAHVLNLVLADTTQKVIASATPLTLLNDIAVFICEPYKRMNVWDEKSKDPHHKRLSLIGETRCCAKDSALKKVFSLLGKPERLYW